MSDRRALIAHLLRRTAFGPLPGQVEAIADGGVEAALDSVLGAAPIPPFPLPDPANGDLAASWLGWMGRSDAGLHEKMTWFWHGHFTSSTAQVDDQRLLYRQHLLLREHALGDFRQLAQAITVDPAMLQYLNGDGSTGDAPNENYARELMELFTMGRGSYSQGDVTAGARALAGWSVDATQRSASYDEGAAYQGSVRYLGHTGRLHSRDVVDIACDHPATAPFIARKIHRYLVGEDPGPARLQQVSDVFSRSGLQIRPLVEAVLRHPSFFERRLNRPRYPVEWVTAASAALGQPSSIDSCNALGQVPFSPPNVAGWPAGNRWLSGSAVLARAALAAQAPALSEISDASDAAGAALLRCGMYEVSDATHATLRGAASAEQDPGKRASLLLGLAVVSPDFALA